MRPVLLCTFILLAALCGCGKRASVMEAPEGANPKAYPRQFPDTSFDPPGTYTPPAKQ